MIQLQAPGLDITFHLRLLDGTKCDVTFHDISRVDANEKIYELQRMTVGTKIDYVSMKQNEVKEDA